MLKRGSSTGGSSRRNRPVDSLSERISSSRSRSSSPRPTNRKTRKNRSRESDSVEDSGDDAAHKKERLKKAGRMKRAPLLDYSIVETVHNAMAGQAQRRASRHWLEQFAKYEDAKRPGVMKGERFTRCLSKMGIQLEKREDAEALAECFKASGGDTVDSDRSDNNKVERATQLVDYAAFVDFACNVRDSEKLSEIAQSLRGSISKYDGKKQSSSSYSIAAGLEKVDRQKRGWITSTQFERVLEREDQGPSFRLSVAQMSTVIDRFEYEYDKQQLGIDYMQFAQWLQPLLHLDVKKVHERVETLIKCAEVQQGWKLGEVFKAMDDDKDGEIDAVELKEALLEMGLPLTDAQIRCLADEYDVDGDGKIQYNEFLSLFSSPNKTRAKVKKRTGQNSERSGDKSDTGSTTDLIKKRKNQPKRNVRNSFSWGINKAFARKQATKSGNRKSNTEEKMAVKGADLSSSAENSSEAPRKKRPTKRKETHDHTSSDEEVAQRTKRGGRTRKRRSDSSDVASSSPSDNQGKVKSNARSNRSTKSKSGPRASSTESEPDTTGREQGKRKASRANRKINEKTRSDDEAKAQDSSDFEAPKQSSKTRSGTKRSEKGSRDVSVRRRSRTLASNSAPRTRSRQKLAQRRSSRHRRRSASFYGQRYSSPQRKRNMRRSRSRLRRSARNNAAHSSDDGENSSFSDNNGSSSGLDVEQLRRRQQVRGQITNRRGSYARSAYGDKTDDDHHENVVDGSENSEDAEGGEEWSRSDDEYHKHLKRSLRRAFDFFDLDQTSSIDKRELSHVLRALGHEFTSKELEAEMCNADLDRNGQLDFYEFVAFVKKQLTQKTYLLSQQREMEIRQSFQSLDTDKNGALDEHEFEYLIYKVLQVELSVEEQDALLDFVDKDADGLISEEEFIGFIKKLESLHRKYSGKGGWKKEKRFLDSLDAISQLAYSAMKKLVRGVPMDIDRSLLMFFGIPSNFRPAISSAATCRTLHGNTMEHVLSFPSPQTIEALALDTRLNDKKDSSWFTLNRLDTSSEEYRMLQQAENVEAQAIVSLKRAAGVPKPFDTREDDVVKRCVHVCLFQEQEESKKATTARRRRSSKAAVSKTDTKVVGAGTVVGNVHEIPVYWHQGEEDVWEFSKKSTKQDKYKFLVRTNAVNDHLYLLVEFIVHLRLNPEEHESNKRSRKRKAAEEQYDSDTDTGTNGGTREMVCCWCKIPVRQLLAKRSDILRRKEKLWGGTANAPVDIEQDELLRRRTGWRAFTNMFTKPSPPLMGIKSVPIDSLADDLQLFVRKMPPIVIAPFVSLPILAEYMALVRKTLACVASSSSVMTCEPALKLLPKIVDDHVALSIFRKAFDSEVATLKPGEERQLKFQQLVLRMWPSFVHWQERLPPSLLPAVKLPGPTPNPKTPVNVPPKGVSAASSSTTDEVNAQIAAQIRFNLLQTTASGKLRLQDVRVPSTPFHVREVAFRRLL
ncbi:Calmodulin-like protein [Phytophthora ramorum]|uniref:Calmodulin-like protein n=1 Tax=Phytophthora ramorum TaxID=164328 RepID=UPI0030A7ECA8|nr:Calmodulin-like protein [Phytophthora ramorum]